MKPALYRYLLVGICLAFFIHSKCLLKKQNPSKNVFSDNFQRADGSPGSNYTSYLPVGTSFLISGQRLQPVGVAASPALYYNQIVTGNYSVSATFQISGGSYTGTGYILARSTSSATIDGAYACGYNNVTLTIGKFVSGVFQMIGEAELVSLGDGNSDPVEFTLNGQTLTCAITSGTNQVSISIEDSTLGDGYVGFSGGGTNSYFFIDSLSIDDL
ncbi:MAG: hypothetical protein JSR44_13495 [Spirochaetes bacterium]|nr:hypothetical protein [Spirochaetota bacterium]